MSDHDWRPVTETGAVKQCVGCGATGFGQHPLPHGPCADWPQQTRAALEPGDELGDFIAAVKGE